MNTDTLDKRTAEEREAHTTQKTVCTDRCMRIPTVTQEQPTDDRHISPTSQGEEPSQQELEQDVIATNPSVESMESRG